MEQRDLIKEQIEQLGKVLAKIISGFFRLKSQGKIARGIEVSNERFKEELDIDIEKIIHLHGEELSDYFKKKNLSPEHLEKIIDYLTEVGEYTMRSDKNSGVKILEKTLELYGIIDLRSKNYSFERTHKEKRIKNLLLK